MNKNQVITNANNLCEQLANLGVNANLEVSHFYNRISIYVFENNADITLKIDTPFTKDNTKLNREIISKLSDLIKKYKQVA